MGKSSGSAPQAPDPRVVIPLQEESNLRQYQTMLEGSRVNQYGPTGSTTWNNNSGVWSQNTNLSPEQQQLYNQNVQSQLQQGNLLQGAGQRVSDQMGQPVDFSSAPALQGSVSGPQFQGANAAPQLNGSLGAPQFQGSSSTPQLQGSFAAPQLQGYENPSLQNLSTSQTQANLQNPQMQALNPGQLSQGVNDALQGYSSKIGQLDPSQFNQQAADALYNQGTRYMQPQMDQDKKALEARLGEQGFVPGTPAYNQAMQNFQDTSNRALADARDRAVTAGVSSGQANFGNTLGALQSQISTALAGGNFQNQQQGQDFSQQQAQANQLRQGGLDANQVAQQLFQNQGVMDQSRNQNTQQNYINAQDAAQRAFSNNNQALQQNFQNQQGAAQFNNQAAQQGFQNQQTAAQFNNQNAQQGFQNEQTAAQFGNQAAQQNFQNQQTATQFNNQNVQQGFQNQLSGAQLGNQARQQSIAEILQQRQLPFNELMALRGGTQVQTPQAQQFQAPNLQAPDVIGAYNNQYQGQLGAYNTQVGAQNSQMSSLGQMGALAAMFLSDRRLKSDIRRVGQTEGGHNLYSYTIFGRPEIGVMADEVAQTHPHLVVQHPSGYLAVLYKGIK